MNKEVCLFNSKVMETVIDKTGKPKDSRPPSLKGLVFPSNLDMELKANFSHSILLNISPIKHLSREGPQVNSVGVISYLGNSAFMLAQ